MQRDCTVWVFCRKISDMRYGQIFDGLIEQGSPPPLGPGRVEENTIQRLADLDLKRSFDGFQVVDRAMAESCLSAIHLLFNNLNPSHRISQGVDTDTGSFWHGIMHRREGDFDNAKYWFRRTGNHPVLETLGHQAVALAAKDPAYGNFATLTPGGLWDPFAFVDLCARLVDSGSAQEDLVIELQMMEWRILFDFSFRNAVDASASLQR